MIKNIHSMTALKPSFGMPTRASVAAPCGTGVVVRDRHLGGGTWALDAVVTDAIDRAFPGTSAWRPPTC